MTDLKTKQVKIISILIAFFFIGGVVAFALTQSGNIALASNSSSVGVIDMQKISDAHPEAQNFRTQMENTINEIRNEFEEKSASMSDQEKSDYYQQCQERIRQKQEELLAPIEQSINEAIKKVADTKGLSVVVNKMAVVYGGQDITQEVINKLGKK